MDHSHFLSSSSSRSVPEAVSSGLAGGQLVPKLPASREDNEVVQLYSSQQPPSAPHLHARHVVSRARAELGARERSCRWFVGGKRRVGLKAGLFAPT